MNKGLIPSRYAKALLATATERGVDARVYDMMRHLAAAFAVNPGLQQAVANPFIPAADKQRLLTTAAEAGVKDTVWADFLKLLAQNHRTDMARDIALAYLRLYRQERNIKVVTITSAAPMDVDEDKRLTSLIQRHIGGATMELDHQVDPNLIGGFTVSINNEKLDASIANELKQLRLKLLSK